MHVNPVYVEHVIAPKNWLSTNTYLVLYHALLYLVPIMVCLRVHSKYSLACHWLFYWPGIRAGYDEDYLGDVRAS